VIRRLSAGCRAHACHRSLAGSPSSPLARHVRSIGHPTRAGTRDARAGRGRLGRGMIRAMPDRPSPDGALARAVEMLEAGTGSKPTRSSKRTSLHSARGSTVSCTPWRAILTNARYWYQKAGRAFPAETPSQTRSPPRGRRLRAGQRRSLRGHRRPSSRGGLDRRSTGRCGRVAEARRARE